MYGGCKGNQNNFLSEIDCVRRCGDEAAIEALDLPDLTTQTTLQEIGQTANYWEYTKVIDLITN